MRTHVSARGRSLTVLANECKRKRTRTQINAPLRLMRGRFLRANSFAFCALDLKLSGCTIYQHAVLYTEIFPLITAHPAASTEIHTVGVKKVPIYRPYNGTGNTVPFPFPFNFRAVAILGHFQTVPTTVKC